uniref:Vrille n=1 Tax=Euphausia superba TaxID=6819 RepID=A0A2I6BQ16_EUPSU|nr:vrille [Euphausia superba]
MAAMMQSNVLQQQMMVAETVKYPVNYPALIPLSPNLAGLAGGFPTCSSSMLHSSYPQSPHILDQKPLENPLHLQQLQLQQQQQQQQQEDSLSSEQGPIGLGANGLVLPNSLDLAAIRKKEMFSQRKQREFIPDAKKDDSYWDRRRRNNEAAKRSREKRRFNDMVLEQRVIELAKENHIYMAQLSAIKDKYGIDGDSMINVEQIMQTFPNTEQILACTKRSKYANIGNGLLNPSSPGSPSTSASSPAEHRDSLDNHNMDMDLSPNHFYSNSHQSSSHHRGESPYELSRHQYPPTSSSSNFYEQSALNLSARPASPSPPVTHMEYSSSDEMSRRSPSDEQQGSCLPLKLRHKTHLGDKDVAASLLALHYIKTEPRDSHADPADDSDDRDSGLGYSSSSSSSSSADYIRPENTSPSMMGNSLSLSQRVQHAHDQDIQEITDYNRENTSSNLLNGNNTHLKTELERLSSEVATLKYLLVSRPRPESDSDGSR